MNPEKSIQKSSAGKWHWWIGKSVQGILSGFFLFFGIELCRAAYRLSDPFFFLMTFFASNLIILISGAILAGCFVHIYLYLKKTGEKRLIKDEV